MSTTAERGGAIQPNIRANGQGMAEWAWGLPHVHQISEAVQPNTRCRETKNNSKVNSRKRKTERILEG